MNSLERVVASMNFQEPDRPPVVPQILGHAAVLTGVELKEYICSGELIAQCQMKALRHYGHDAVFTLLDMSLEAEAAGTELKYLHDYYPSVKTHLQARDIDIHKIPNPYKDGRMPEILTSLELLRKEVGDEVLICGAVTGPLTMTLQLLGPEAGLYLAIDDPEAFCRVMDYATELGIRFGKAQVEAGAHVPILFDPAATPSLAPAQFFREFELPRLTKSIAAFKQAGALGAWLHIAGLAAPIMPYYPEAGVDIANFDFCISAEELQQVLPNMCVDGNVRPLAFMEETPEEIATASNRLLQAFAARGGFILSSGCEIPPESDPQCIAAMVEAAHSYPRER